MLQIIYNELVRRNLVRSLRHFSEAYMCRAPNYAVDVKRPSAETLSFLHTKLMQAGQDDLALQVLLLIFDQARENIDRKKRGGS